MILQSPLKIALESAKLSNNGRINELHMTSIEKRGAELAVSRGLMTKHFMVFPGFGPVAAYQLA